jgi:hypothetical protein
MAKTIPSNEQVFMVSKSTNTTYSGSAALKAMSEWYTMDDVSNTVKPYKVFTALLRQQGDSSEGEVDGDGGTIVKGITYYINVNPDNFDLTIYGAPNNNAGTYFIANQTISLPYNYTLQLYYNEGAPVATVLENTIGNLWFTYNGTGNYTLNSDGVFTNSTWTNISLNIQGFGDNINFSIYKYSPNYIGIVSGIPGDSQYNDCLDQSCIEVRVYN